MQPIRASNQGFPTSTSPARGWQSLPESYCIPDKAPSLVQAQRYCEQLARTHYENFSVASWFLPRHLQQHFFNVYAYCRISDDLGDEVGDAKLSLELLDLWEEELDLTYASLLEAPLRELRSEVARLPLDTARLVPAAPRHPVFVALRETITRFNIPRQTFADLLIAFRQDQTVTRFRTFADVLGYCRYSANPVGHLVLYLCGYSDPERQQLSDFTCTALQLANFWQDVYTDWKKGRLYIPLEDMERFGVVETDIADRHFSPKFRELMRFEVQRAREWFYKGLPLVRKVRPRLAIDIELFSRGGLEILNAIERQDFDVLSSRPVISGSRKLWLVFRAGFAGLRSLLP